MDKPEVALPTQATVETLNTVHLTGVVSRSLSTDGATAMIVFTVGDKPGQPDRKFAITLPAAQLGWLRGILNDLVVDTQRINQPAGAKLLHFPQEFSIGNNKEMRGPGGDGFVIIMFDTNTEKEMAFVISNLSGLQMAEGLRKDIMPRLTSQEREQMHLLKPQSAGIIRPNG